jgi:hypothetical protein
LLTLRAELELAWPIGGVFGFFADAGGLAWIAPQDLRFHMRTPGPIRIHTGTLIDYELSSSG